MFPIIATILALLTSTAAAVSYTAISPVPEFDVNRSVPIVGDITSAMVLPTVTSLFQYADASSAPIDMVIASPGGELTAGFMIINAMEVVHARGIAIRCFVPTVAASMAFQVLLHCNERHVFDKALLLWHEVRISMGGGFMAPPIYLSADDAMTIAVALRANNRLVLGEITRILSPDMSAETVRYHFRHETLHVGSQLAGQLPHLIHSYPSISGVMEAALAYGQKEEGPSGGKQGRRSSAPIPPGTIIYRWRMK